MKRPEEMIRSTGHSSDGPGSAGMNSDYSGIGLTMGSIMMVAGFIVFIFNFAFAITSLAWGAIIASLSLHYRHRSLERSQALQRLVISEDSRLRLAADRTRLAEVILSRLPDDTAPDQLKDLLVSIASGDEPQSLDDWPEDGHAPAARRLDKHAS